jgi:hypothetical protein
MPISTENGHRLLVYQDPLARITFSAHPTCHSVNYATACHTTLDVVIGFNTGDLVWFGKYPLSSARSVQNVLNNCLYIFSTAI